MLIYVFTNNYIQFNFLLGLQTFQAPPPQILQPIQHLQQTPSSCSHPLHWTALLFLIPQRFLNQSKQTLQIVSARKFENNCHDKKLTLIWIVIIFACVLFISLSFYVFLKSIPICFSVSLCFFSSVLDFPKELSEMFDPKGENQFKVGILCSCSPFILIIYC